MMAAGSRRGAATFSQERACQQRWCLGIGENVIMGNALDILLREVRACTLCAEMLPHAPRPVLQVGSGARVLIAGQAPGRRVHESGVPFDDPSGDRFREWMGVTRDEFYDASRIVILPMGFCYPGSAKSGDLPPRPECAPAWRDQLLRQLPAVRLTIVMGRYAMDWHVGQPRQSVTEAVAGWKRHRPGVIPLPHPSPRNRLWLRANPWFERDVLPYLRRRVRQVLR